ncbi:MAG: D-alanine--D-alanine ligase [Clostridiales bacterium]|mgnify:CR=1 FL=1|nr:MAG: D-alanine--D-alanine ligase [Clostridiales bacterium]
MNSQNKYSVALTYNLKNESNLKNEDDQAEFDSIETVQAIARAIEKTGCRVVPMEATRSIVNEIQNRHIDMVFNFAEGLKGRGRESQVPALLSFLSIPFTGSDETTLAIGLDKALSKRIAMTENIRTPKFQIFFNSSDVLKKSLQFPLIVKPNAEGSSKGIIDSSIASDEYSLKLLTDRIIESYEEPAIVEEYVPGREFTVGLLGNGKDVEVLPLMEILFEKDENPFYSYNVKKNSEKFIRYECPAKIDSKLEKKIKRMALRIFTSLQCRDVARIDIRVSEKDNEPYFIEINPLPGLIDGFSDLTIIARSANMEYDQLIRRILNEAFKRYGMNEV